MLQHVAGPDTFLGELGQGVTPAMMFLGVGCIRTVDEQSDALVGIVGRRLSEDFQYARATLRSQRHPCGIVRRIVEPREDIVLIFHQLAEHGCQRLFIHLRFFSMQWPSRGRDSTFLGDCVVGSPVQFAQQDGVARLEQISSGHVQCTRTSGCDDRIRVNAVMLNHREPVPHRQFLHHGAEVRQPGQRCVGTHL